VIATRDQQLSAELFEEILHNLRGQQQPKDKREDPRVGVRNRVMVQPMSNPDDTTPLPARVRDLSPNGIGLLTERPLMPQSRFSIRLEVGGGPQIMAVYRVARCTQVGQGLYGVGAQLEKVQNQARQQPPKSAI